ncbi:MAG: T9SS type A sorting domain-containing protein [candidate division WOR-3 bacterium]
MYKYITLSLFIFLAFAGTAKGEEIKWLQYPQEGIAIENPFPTPHLTEFPPAEPNDSPDVDTLFYDDRSGANAWVWYRQGNGWGVKFIPPADNVTLNGALLYLWDASWPVPGGNRYLIKVYDDDGPNGAPRTQLFASETLSGTRGAWNYATINIPITGPFYLFYVQADSYPLCPGLGIDRYDNAPDNVEWQVVGGDFSPDKRAGEWLLRPVIDWTPQNKNLASIIFGNLPLDTIPRITLTLRASVRNMGLDTVPRGVPVKLQITGPLGYFYQDVNETTSTALARRASQQITFSPGWRIPDTAGNYKLTVWHEYALDQFRKDDTIKKTIGVARWLTYANWNNPYWVTWAGSERAVKFTPSDFGQSYPFRIQRLRHQFYYHSQAPWPDSAFQFKIYANDGQTLLYESDTIKAVSYPLVIEHDVTNPPTITSGDFWVSVAPRSASGHPSTLADNVTTRQKSYFGAPGYWYLWGQGEFFTAVAVGGVTAIEDIPAKPIFEVETYPNPGTVVKVRWQVRNETPVKIALYDAIGREVKKFYESSDARANSGILEIGRDALPAGIYIFQLRTPTETYNRKVVLH